MTTDLVKPRDAIAGAADFVGLRAALEGLGIAHRESDIPWLRRGDPRLVTFPLDRPVDARELCDLMGWDRPYAVSGDVHQVQWSIRVWTSDMADPYGKRIATQFPLLGEWAVIARLAGRPRGELPDLVSGASPAYDLHAYEASVGGLEVWPKVAFY